MVAVYSDFCLPVTKHQQSSKNPECGSSNGTINKQQAFILSGTIPNTLQALSNFNLPIFLKGK